MSKVLLPLLSKKESNENFLEKVIHKAKEVDVLLIIDTKAMAGSFGFVGSEVFAGRKLMDEICKKIGKKRKTGNALLEWGDTFNTIVRVAKLKGSEKIFLIKQNNKYFRDLIDVLKKEKIKFETLNVKD